MTCARGFGSGGFGERDQLRCRGLPDSLERDFTADEWGCKLVGDITYIRTSQGWVYLATVLDCVAKRTVGYAMADHMRTKVIVEARGERTGPIAGMVSIDDRDEAVAGRRVPGHWEGDLVIGAFGRFAVVTLVERTIRYTVILGLPNGKRSVHLTDALIEHATSSPVLMQGPHVGPGLGDGPPRRPDTRHRHARVLRPSTLPVGARHE